MPGYLIILCGYIGWGLFPLYWSMLAHVPSLEVLLHRMFWAVPLLLILVIMSTHRRIQVMAAFRSGTTLCLLTISSLIICLNWGGYIWAIANQRVVEASMGYFLTPLLNVLTGVIVFRERINTIILISIACAAIGVFYYIISTATVPWIGLMVGICFAIYGLLRKQMATNAIPGLFIETLILLPFTLLLIMGLHSQEQASFLNHDLNTDLLLILSGPVTVLPLVFFTVGSRLLPMFAIGILFYITPTLQFLCGVFILDEAFDNNRLIGFIGIWIGLAIFSLHLIQSHQKTS